MDIRIHRIFVGLALFLLLLMAACNTVPTNTGSTTASTSDQAYPPLNLHYDADRYEFTTPESMCSSILIADVSTITRGSSHWNTVNGLRPQISAAKNETLSRTIVEQGYRIYTPVRFATLHPLKDHRRMPTKEFVTAGGQVQQDQYWINPFPQLKETDHYVIVFGPGSQPAGKGKVEEWLVVYKAFPVDTHGMVTLQQASSPNEPGSGKPQPEVKLSLTDLQSQLAACK